MINVSFFITVARWWIGITLLVVLLTVTEANPVDQYWKTSVSYPTSNHNPTGVADSVLEWAMKHNSSASEYTVQSIIAIAFAESSRQQVDPLLTLAVIAKESKFDVTADYGGAKGLMQVIPKWHRDKITKTQVYDPTANIRAGVQILKGYLKLAGGDLHKALLYYNGSSRNPKSTYGTRVLSLRTDLKRTIERSNQNEPITLSTISDN